MITSDSTISIAEQQQVEIARALKDKSRVLVMDEPTAALSDRESEHLFEVIRKLRSDGIAIIYISHRMEEIYALADRISVLRDGQYIGSLTRSEISPQRLVQMMVGRSMQDFYEHQRQMHPGPVVLEVRNMSDARKKVEPTSFKVHAGEIVGFYAGKIADRYGRVKAMVAASVLFTISAIGSGIAFGIWDFIFWRLLGGIAVGAASVIAPAYIAECSPSHLRGRLGSLQQLAIVIGIFIALLCDYFIAVSAGSAESPFLFGIAAWRWMFWTEIPPAILYGMSALMNDSRISSVLGCSRTGTRSC